MYKCLICGEEVDNFYAHFLERHGDRIVELIDDYWLEIEETQSEQKNDGED